MIKARPLSVIRQFPSSLNQFHNSFFALLFPWSCPGCGTLVVYPRVLCDVCELLLQQIHPPFCKRCGTPFPEHWRVKVCADCKLHKSRVTAIRSAFDYEGLVAQMIKEAKYLRKGRYLRYFAEKLFILARTEFPSSIKAIVPVPLHRARQWNRTFNQAETLARAIAKLWGLPVWDVLRKTKVTMPQSSLSGTVRRINLRNAFQFHGNGRKFRSVLLVDDVTTTGSTLNECARVLKQNGVKRVFGVTIARADLR
jgi:ComF family protein